MRVLPIANWRGRLDSDELNLRAAIERTLAAPQGPERVLQQFWSLQRFWRHARHPEQTLVLLERALDQIGSNITMSQRGEALYCKALLLGWIDRRLELDTLLSTLELTRRAGNRALEADVLSRYSRSLTHSGRVQESLAAGAEAVALARRIGDPVLLAMVLSQYAVALSEGEASGAEAVFLEALALVEPSGALLAMMLHNNYGLLLLGKDSLTDARRHTEIALELAGGELTSVSAGMYSNMGWILLQEGDLERAVSLLVDLLRSCWLNGSTGTVPYVVLALACCATRRGTSDRAAKLHGGADELLLAGSDQWESLEASLRAQDIAVLRDRLGDDFERLYADGLALPPDQIIRLAVSAY